MKKMPKIANTDGFILPTTMILLAVLVSTSMGFAFLALSDIKKAKSVDDSIVAYYAADAGLEKSLYLIKKQQSIARISELVSEYPSPVRMETTTAQYSLASSTDFESNYYRQRLMSGETAKLYFLSQAAANGAKSFTVNWTKGANSSGINLQVTMTQLKPQTKDGLLVYLTDDSRLEREDTAQLNSLSEGGNRIACYNFSNQGQSLLDPPDYLIEIKALGSDSSEYVDNLSVIAYDKECSTNIAKADDAIVKSEAISNLTIRSTGVYQGTSQTIYGYVPPYDPLSGMMSFVLFGENDIYKDKE